MSVCWPIASVMVSVEGLILKIRGTKQQCGDSRPAFRPEAAGACLLSIAGLVLVATVPVAVSAAPPAIYTCVDANGRRITSDRPIKACIDREQKVLGKSGTVTRVVPPSYTAEEREQIELQQRREKELQVRADEERRQNKALLVRYTNKQEHDTARAEALRQVDEVISAVQHRSEVLRDERKKLDQEMEFYQKNPEKAPAWLKRQIEDHEQQQKVQQRFLMDQLEEKVRINLRFDEELARLRKLWAQYGYKDADAGGPGNGTPPASMGKGSN